MALTIEQVAALTVGERVSYSDPFGIEVPGTVAINDGAVLEVALDNASALTYALANCPGGIDSLSLPAPTQ